MFYDYSNTAIICQEVLTEFQVLGALKKLQKKNLQNLFIMSLGGRFDAVEMGLQHLMPRKVTTIGGEIVGSAALSIFLCGERRLALHDSKFTFHEAFMFYESRPLRESEIEMKI